MTYEVQQYFGHDWFGVYIPFWGYMGTFQPKVMIRTHKLHFKNNNNVFLNKQLYS